MIYEEIFFLFVFFLLLKEKMTRIVYMNLIIFFLDFFVNHFLITLLMFCNNQTILQLLFVFD